MQIIHTIDAQVTELRDGGWSATAHDNYLTGMHPHDVQHARPRPKGYLKGPKRLTFKEAKADGIRFLNELLKPYEKTNVTRSMNTASKWFEIHEPVWPVQGPAPWEDDR